MIHALVGVFFLLVQFKSLGLFSSDAKVGV